MIQVVKGNNLFMKTTLIIGVACTGIGLFAGYQLTVDVMSKRISITTFKINVPFGQWASGFDSKDAEKMHRSNNIKPIFRGVSIKDPRQVVVIHQS